MMSSKDWSAPGSGLNVSTGAQLNHNQALRMAEAGPDGQSWSNMPVDTASGQSLGFVTNLVPGLNGKRSSGYVVVSIADGKCVPVPYLTARSRVRHGKLILSRSRFMRAPKASVKVLQNRSDHAWRIRTDRYWMRKGRGHTQK
jgi:hypothetical protein